MKSSNFKVEQIDHVELFVPDRYEAAQWFERTLGLKVLKEYEPWAVPGGPLMISSDGGKTKLALFEGRARGSRPTAGHHRVAFRAGGESFLQFLENVKLLPVFDEDGKECRELRVVDHAQAFSVYFCDRYGNRFEVTCYDHGFVRQKLDASELEPT